MTLLYFELFSGSSGRDDETGSVPGEQEEPGENERSDNPNDGSPFDDKITDQSDQVKSKSFSQDIDLEKQVSDELEDTLKGGLDGKDSSGLY